MVFLFGQFPFVVSSCHALHILSEHELVVDFMKLLEGGDVSGNRCRLMRFNNSICVPD